MASIVVTRPIAIAKAFSPGHITGFFEVPRSLETDPLHKGSKGAGFCIDRGVETTVYVYAGTQRSEILINGQAVRPEEAEVSKWVVDHYLEKANRQYFVKIEHNVGIPVGHGLGSSGAAALSLSYALNETLGTGLDRTEAAQIAHKAEVACKTGLGTVIAEYYGGFEMRRSVGAPGIGIVDTLSANGYKAIILCISPISTKTFLGSRMDKIDGLGGKMLADLAVSKNIDDFLTMSYEFASALGLAGGKCAGPAKALKESGFGCGIALFGHTVFTIIPEEMAAEVERVLQKFDGTLLSCKIDCKGARVI